jgi:hypothetical protein
LPSTTCQSVTGEVSNNSIVPNRRSSAKRRIVTIGKTMNKMTAMFQNK